MILLVVKNNEKVKNQETVLGLIFQASKSSSKTDSSSEKPATVEKKKRNTLEDLIINENTLIAEIQWTFKVVMLHLSLRSCTDFNKLFVSMFPDSEVASKFTLGKTKCDYFVNYGIAPHLKNILTKAIIEPPFYSLSFDETLNAVNQSCQMDVGIRYWDNAESLVQTRYFDSKFLQRPNTEILFEKIRESLTELHEDRLIQLSMDGPSVYWNVLEKLDDYLTNKDIPETIYIGSCNQHILHGAFQTAVQSSGLNIDKVLKSMYWILHDSPAKREVFCRESGGDVFPLR